MSEPFLEVAEHPIDVGYVLITFRLESGGSDVRCQANVDPNVVLVALAAAVEEVNQGRHER